MKSLILFFSFLLQMLIQEQHFTVFSDDARFVRILAVNLEYPIRFPSRQRSC